MTNKIQEFKTNNPMYEGIPDEELARVIYEKKYSSVMPYEKFEEQAGIRTPQSHEIDAPDGETAIKILKGQLDTSSPTNQAKTFNEKYNLGQTRIPENYGHLAHAIEQGAALGFGDEALAGFNAAGAKVGSFFGGPDVDMGDVYDQGLAIRRKQMAEYEENNPKSAFASLIAGGLFTGGLASMSGLTAMKNAKTAKAAAKGAAIDGAGYGALIGAGSDNGGVIDRLKSAGGGILGGATAGGAGSFALTGMGSLGRLLVNKIKSNTGSVENQAKARLVDAAHQSGLTIDEMKNKIAGMGDESALIDALGEPGYSLGRSASNVSPEARDTLNKMTEIRIAGQPDRVANSLKDASGLNRNYTTDELISAMRTNERPAVNQAYDAAKAAGQDLDVSIFSDILESNTVKEALKEGTQTAIEGRIARGAPGKPTNFEIWDEVKKVLDDWSQPPANQPRQNYQQKTAEQFANLIRIRIDDLTPEYKAARMLAQDVFNKENAIKLGESIAKPFQGDLSQKINSINQHNRDYIKQGYSANKMNQLSNRRATPGAIDALFGSKNQQEALKAALGDAGEKVIKQLDTERAFARTQNALKGNSTTARQLADMGFTGAVGAGAGLGLGGNPESAGAGALATLLARKVAGRGTKALRAGQEKKVASILAEALVGKAPPAGWTGTNKKAQSVWDRMLLNALSQQSAHQLN